MKNCGASPPRIGEPRGSTSLDQKSQYQFDAILAIARTTISELNSQTPNHIESKFITKH